MSLRLMGKLAQISVILLHFSLSAHQGHHEKEVVPAEANEEVSPGIIKDYEQNVAAVFQNSCFNCHSGSTKYPWYAKMPYAKGLIESDVTEAREHLDMSDGFPFKGHGTVVEDLKAIRDSISKNEMPPLRYRMMHWASWLSQDEKKRVLEWVDRSLTELGGVGG